MDYNSMNEILDFAISKEEEACNFYIKLANQVKFANMRQVFLEFANQEEGHKAKLIQVKSGKIVMPSNQIVKDLKIGDHLVDIKITDDLSYQEALIVAMKAEKNAFLMYTSLAEAATDSNFKALLFSLASEEANHKLRFEIEYDNQFMGEN